jgi:hypothetical protein
MAQYVRQYALDGADEAICSVVAYSAPGRANGHRVAFPERQPSTLLSIGEPNHGRLVVLRRNKALTADGTLGH